MTTLNVNVLKVPSYKCLGKKHHRCNKSVIRKDILEKLVLDKIVSELNRPQIMNAIVANLDCLIKEIILYDDKIEIYFNSPIKISPDESRGFTFYTENIKITYKDPHRSESVIIQAVFKMKI